MIDVVTPRSLDRVLVCRNCLWTYVTDHEFGDPVSRGCPAPVYAHEPDPAITGRAEWDWFAVRGGKPDRINGMTVVSACLDGQALGDGDRLPAIGGRVGESPALETVDGTFTSPGTATEGGSWDDSAAANAGLLS